MQMRYTPTRKATIIRQIKTGAKTRSEVMAEHHLSDEELAEWERDDKLGTGAHKRTGAAYIQRRRKGIHA